MTGRWWDDAACRPYPTDWWFPTDRHLNNYEKARTICNDCPVKTECLDDAVTLDDRHGMWGGQTPEERREEAARYEWRSTLCRICRDEMWWKAGKGGNRGGRWAERKTCSHQCRLEWRRRKRQLEKEPV